MLQTRSTEQPQHTGLRGLQVRLRARLLGGAATAARHGPGLEPLLSLNLGEPSGGAASYSVMQILLITRRFSSKTLEAHLKTLH